MRRLNFDWALFAATIALCVIGLTILYSAGYNPELGKSAAMERQAVSMLVGVGAYFVGMVFPVNFWRQWAFVFYGAGVMLLIAILFVGIEAGGAHRWIDLFGVRFQPSEIMKVGLILAVARVLSGEKVPEKGYGFFDLLLPAGVLLLPFVITLIQPDLGTAICQALVGGTILLMAGIQGKTLARLALFGAVMLFPAWGFLHDYQKKRVLNFLSPEMDPLGSGYHAIQSMIAVGSGGELGKGFLQGTQTQLRFLPEQTTDFLFSVFAEEWGFVGSVLILVLYAFLVFRLVQIGARASDRFSAYLCLGAAALVFWQVVINVGMVTGSLPVVGITLPLLSYGGSSVVTIMTALGVAAGVSARRFRYS